MDPFQVASDVAAAAVVVVVVEVAAAARSCRLDAFDRWAEAGMAPECCREAPREPAAGWLTTRLPERARLAGSAAAAAEVPGWRWARVLEQQIASELPPQKW